MNILMDYFKQAELALAAYADLDIGTPNTLFLEEAGMSMTQAQHFSKNWRVVEQYNHSEQVPVLDAAGNISGYVEVSNGLSVTVFEEISSGRRHLAIRGTDDGVDLITDLFDIALLGTPFFHDQYKSLRLKVQEWLDNGILPDSFTVAGHSLGGFLSTGLSAEFAGHIEHAYLYNSPGLESGAGDLLALILEAMDISFSPDPAIISNIKASAGISPIAGLGEQVAEPVWIQIEDQFLSDVPNPPAARNHSQQVLTDTLAVYSLIGQLAPALTVDQIGEIVQAASLRNVETLESLVNGLAELLGVATIGTENRDEFYNDFYAIREIINNGGNTLQLTSLVGAPITNLLSSANAPDGVAYRYALQELNPFVMTGDDAIYGNHNLNGELNLDSFSGNYLGDRAAFLALKIELGIKDNHRKTGAQNVTYIDVSSGETLNIRKPAGAGQLPDAKIIFSNSRPGDTVTVTGGSQADRLYGFMGNDILAGHAGADYIEGGRGDDVLYGNSMLDPSADDHMSDMLIGGEGHDTYHAGLGDIIEDGDGRGVIMENGMAIPVSNITASAQGSDVFTNNDPDKPVRFKFLPDGSLQVIGSYLVIRNFNNGDFGIHLDPGATTPGINYIEGTDLDDRPGSQNGPIYGTESEDEIRGLGGDDDIDGLEGDDVIFAGAGEDLLEGGAGHDVIDGGEGRDAIHSGPGRDVLVGGGGDDFLSGFDEDDYLEGGHNNDFLAGGAGSDTLLGGPDDDVLIGDGVYFAFNRDWEVMVTDTLPGVPGGEVVSFNAFIIGNQSSADDQADYLEGGSGNDLLFGGGGNDQLNGNEDDDVLEGGAGDDLLKGGDGGDVLWGDISSTPGVAGNDILYGGEGKDFLDGGAGDDFLSGGAGADDLRGGDGNDEIEGDADDDIVFAHAGDDFADGGEGNDQIDGGIGNDILSGGPGNDMIRGDAGMDFIDGGDGDDLIFGNDDDDILHGGAGIDTLVGGDGNDIIFGGFDDDLIGGDAGDDELHGGDGGDQIQGNDGNDILYGGDGSDFLFGQGDDDQLHGGTGDDQLTGGIGNDVLDGGDGDDALFGMTGNDVLDGGAGLDILQGGEGDDVLSGGADRDLLFGEAGNDSLGGGAGDDQLTGGSGNDSLSGGNDNDVLFGNDGLDILSGGNGNDELQGGNDEDILRGDAGDDRLFGDDGEDTLHGDTGNDLLMGDAGDDVYLFNPGDGMDTIVEQGDSLGDFILLGAGITPDIIFITRINNDLIITHALDVNDRLTVRNWFIGPENKLDRIEFADGTIWNQAAIEFNVNFSPDAQPDVVTGDEDTDIFISTTALTANDADPDSDALSVVEVNNAVNGTVAFDGNDSIVFTPGENFAGNAFFDYTVTDNRGGFDTQTVTVIVNDLNDAPVAVPDLAVIKLEQNPADVELTGGQEIRVNMDSLRIRVRPEIAVLTNGRFIIVWSDDFSDPGNGDVYGQIFDGEGNKVGGQIFINTYQAGEQIAGDVTALPDGSFFVTWSSEDPASGDNSFRGISGQRFDASGNRIGDEILINTFTSDHQSTPVITVLNGGRFVVAWHTLDPSAGDNSIGGIAGQVFDQEGNKVGGEFLVNTYLSGLQTDPAISSLTGDGFVITWQTQDSGAGDGDKYGISGQLFDSAGNKIGTEFLVNTSVTGDQMAPATASLENGGFVVTWTNIDPAAGGGLPLISGQIFDPSGTKVGNEFSVTGFPVPTTPTAGSMRFSNVAGLPGGGFVVTWDGADLVSDGIFAQIFDSNGEKAGDEFQVNITVNGSQRFSDITSLDDSTIALAWYEENVNKKIYARIFSILGKNSVSIDVLSNDTDVDAGDNQLNFSLDSVSLQGNKGQVTIVNNHLVFEAGSDFDFLNEGETYIVTVDYAMSDDGGLSSSSNVTITITGINDPPVVANPLPEQATDEDTLYSFTVPEDTFIDPDIGDSIVDYAAALIDGSALPGWLDFDKSTRTLSGVPANDNVGNIGISISATDTAGYVAVDTFTLSVRNINDAPTVGNPITDQIVNVGDNFSFIIPADAFLDFDRGDTFSFTAVLVDGSPLPGWLSFGATGQFAGVPGISDRGTVSVVVSATDSGGLTASDIFNLTVNAVPVTNPDTFLAFIDTPLNIPASELLANDGDLDGDVITLAAVGSAINGMATLGADGNVLFIPLPGYTGPARFEYTASDGKTGTATNTVTVNVFNPVYGDGKDNVLSGTAGDDFIDGGAGNDTLHGNAGNDLLIGGAGNDLLIGGTGNDTYRVGRNEGKDILLEANTAEGGDILQFDDNIAFADVQLFLTGKDLVFTLKGTGDSITLQQWKSGKSTYPISVEFGDGSTLLPADLYAKFIAGSTGNDALRGSRQNDYLYGLAGNDRVLAKDGDDVIDGGAGDDWLEGMSGNDIYQFTAGWGNDTIMENDITPGNSDTVSFGSGILPIDLMFSRNGNDLLVSRIGEMDTVHIQDWYRGQEFQTEIFKTSDGSVLLNTQIDQLIQAMAGFSAGTGLDWINAVQQRPEEVEAILAASWQSTV